jgi:hypothetical protein
MVKDWPFSRLQDAVHEEAAEGREVGHEARAATHARDEAHLLRAHHGVGVLDEVLG